MVRTEAVALRFARMVATAAAVGFVLVDAAAAVLQRDQAQTQRGMAQLGPPVDMALIYLFVLPPLSWLLLRLIGVRPASVVALLGWLAVWPVILLFDEPGGLHRTAWEYGLQGALAYAVGAVLVASGRLLIGPDRDRAAPRP